MRGKQRQELLAIYGQEPTLISTISQLSASEISFTLITSLFNSHGGYIPLVS